MVGGRLNKNRFAGGLEATIGRTERMVLMAGGGLARRPHRYRGDRPKQ